MRVGLTGGIGSGKTTVAGMFAELGARVLSADEIARGLMQAGTPVSAAIVAKFGGGVVREDGTLNRAELGRLAFGGGRAEELNAIVHPATIRRQEELSAEILAQDPAAVVMVESALIFETRHSRGWRGRFDKLVLVRASEEHKVERFVTRSGGADKTPEERTALAREAKLRLREMIPDDVKAATCDFVVMNDGTLERLRVQVEKVWGKLRGLRKATADSLRE